MFSSTVASLLGKRQDEWCVDSLWVLFCVEHQEVTSQYINIPVYCVSYLKTLYLCLKLKKWPNKNCNIFYTLSFMLKHYTQKNPISIWLMQVHLVYWESIRLCQEAGILFLTLPLISCVILAKSVKFSVSSFIQLMDNRLYIIKIPSSYKILLSLFHDLMHVLSIACQVK